MGVMSVQSLLAIWPTMFITLAAISGDVKASVGDNLAYFQRCLTHCELKNCSSPSRLRSFRKNQPIHLKFLGWTCEEECKYSCQWNTVNFLLHEVAIDFKELPQFYGKWTFYRIFGIQEPSSAIFSLCNLVTTYIAWTRYCRCILKNTPPTSSNKWIESLFTVDTHFFIISLNAIIAMNAWLWSIVFHVHDTPLTERMDYFFAFSVVLFSFYAVVVRFVEEQLGEAGHNLKMTLSLLMPFLSYYIYHIYYLTYVQFDYGFNMKANLVAGFSSSFLWLFWAYKRLHGMPWSRIKNHHVAKCVISVVLVNALLLFELNDFPPFFFLFDAHSLWHLGTIGVPFLWFSFFQQEALSKLKLSKAE